MLKAAYEDIAGDKIEDGAIITAEEFKKAFSKGFRCFSMIFNDFHRFSSVFNDLHRLSKDFSLNSKRPGRFGFRFRALSALSGLAEDEGSAHGRTDPRRLRPRGSQQGQEAELRRVRAAGAERRGFI